jgi:hypothetical protein
LINETERRALLRIMTEARAPRHASTEKIDDLMMNGEQPQTANLYKRRKVQSFIQKNWEYVHTTLKCNGDCSSPKNKCSDAQATSCYADNKNEVEA